MTTINLKDYYPWYLTNEYIEVSDEVAAELRAGQAGRGRSRRACPLQQVVLFPRL